MKRTNHSRRFDKQEINLQKVCTHGPSQSPGHIRIQSEIITHNRTALSFISQHSKRQNDSQTAKSHLISQNFSMNLFCQLANARTAKKLPIEAVVSVASVDQNIPIEQTHFLNQWSAVNDINFQQTLQREAF